MGCLLLATWADHAVTVGFFFYYTRFRGVVKGEKTQQNANLDITGRICYNTPSPYHGGVTADGRGRSQLKGGGRSHLRKGVEDRVVDLDVNVPLAWTRIQHTHETRNGTREKAPEDTRKPPLGTVTVS